jgi:hypothetical protein
VCLTSLISYPCISVPQVYADITKPFSTFHIPMLSKLFTPNISGMFENYARGSHVQACSHSPHCNIDYGNCHPTVSVGHFIQQQLVNCSNYQETKKMLEPKYWAQYLNSTIENLNSSSFRRLLTLTQKDLDDVILEFAMSNFSEASSILSPSPVLIDTTAVCNRYSVDPSLSDSKYAPDFCFKQNNSGLQPNCKQDRYSTSTPASPAHNPPYPQTQCVPVAKVYPQDSKKRG